MKDDFPVLRIRYAEDSPRIDSHTHPACELIFVREGEVRIQIDGRQYLAGPGTLTLIGALEQHELEVVKQPYIRHFCILSPYALERSGLDPVLAGVFKNRPHSFRHCIRLNDSRPAERLFEQLEVEDLERAPYAEQAAMGLIEQLLILLYRAAPEVFFRPDASPAAQKVWEAQRFLEQHLDEPVTVKQLAANCYLSPDHLTRLFKQMTGDLMYYLTNRRGAAYKCALDSLVHRQILSHPAWRTADDSLKVISFARILEDLLSKTREGSPVPGLKINGTLKRCSPGGAVVTKEGKFRLDKTGGKTNYIIFHTEGCPICKAEIAAADSLLSDGKKNIRILLIDMDMLFSAYPDQAQALFDAFDLTSMPLIISTDRKGTVTGRYLSLVECP